MSHAGGFTCAEADAGAQDMAAGYSELREQLADLRALVEACDAIPDITLSKWACDPGGHWNPLRATLRARRAAQGFDVDAVDPSAAYDEQGWLKQRKAEPR